MNTAPVAYPINIVTIIIMTVSDTTIWSITLELSVMLLHASLMTLVIFNHNFNQVYSIIEQVAFNKLSLVLKIQK